MRVACVLQYGKRKRDLRLGEGLRIGLLGLWQDESIRIKAPIASLLDFGKRRLGSGLQPAGVDPNSLVLARRIILRKDCAIGAYSRIALVLAGGKLLL